MSTDLKPHTRWSTAVLLGAVASLVLGIIVLAFLWPGKTSGVHNLPVSIAGPEPAVAALKSVMSETGTFDFVDAADRDEAIKQVEARQTYGAIILAAPPATPEVLTAPAGSPVAAQLLNGVASKLQEQASQQIAAQGGNPGTVKVTVTPVVPLAESDPSGAGLASASFPLAIGGVLGGVLISVLVSGTYRQLASAGGFAIAAGLVVGLILQPWFNYIQGDFWLNSLAMSATMFATASFIIGCASLLGRSGIALGAVVTILLGNTLSAAATPWQFLAEPWGLIGQYLVPGASTTLIRSLSYFPNADTSQQWWTLIAWILLGVLLAFLGQIITYSKQEKSTADPASA